MELELEDALLQVVIQVQELQEEVLQVRQRTLSPQELEAVLWMVVRQQPQAALVMAVHIIPLLVTVVVVEVQAVMDKMPAVEQVKVAMVEMVFS